MKRLASGPRRVVVAMSGGVDSSATAGLLVEAGHDVVGVMMKLYDHSDGGSTPDKQCCGLDDVADARRVADHLGIPFFVGNYRRAFQEAVVDDFVSSYLEGRTPNPCVRCNDTVKFETLLERAGALGADYLATGHYVRTRVEADGAVALLEAKDPAKDQSYFVAGIRPSALERVVFPLGDLPKDEVRAHAERLGLPVASKPDSQEICFVEDDDYARFVEAAAGDRLPGAGTIVDPGGLAIGRHRGIHRYTVGQRRGLGLPGPERRYVVHVDAERNQVVVGGADDVLALGVEAVDTRWLVSPPAPGTPVRARVRHRHGGVAARVRFAAEDRLVVDFEAPVSAVTPGQQLVLYAGERVLGAARITRPVVASGTSAMLGRRERS